MSGPEIARTDLRKSDRHASWREVYAECGVNPDRGGHE